MSRWPTLSGAARDEGSSGYPRFFVVGWRAGATFAAGFGIVSGAQNTLLLSVVSIWEMQIKVQLGKLKLSVLLRDMVESQQKVNGIEVLPVTLEHVLAVEELPAYHKDPFDRLLIAQAVVEKAVLLSKDANLTRYGVQVMW